MRENTASTRRRFIQAICTDTRGAVLTVALMMITVLAMLGMMSITTTTMESSISGNFYTTTQAFSVAEAGIQHAIGILNDPGGASNGFNDELTTSGGEMLNTFALNGGTYTVTATDNNDDADLTTDSDSTIVLTSLGSQGQARQTTQVVVTRAPIELKGLITQDDLEIPGNAVVSGSCGNVHSNGNMDISGNPIIDQNCSAVGTVSVSGTATVNGTMTDGAPEVPIPIIDPATLAGQADYQLRSDGIVYDAGGNLIANANGSPWNVWEYNAGGGDNGAGQWTLSQDSTVNGMLYLEGDVKISGNVGEGGPPWETTVLATGSLEISGNINITNYKNPAHDQQVQNLLFVAGLDLKINGNPSQNWAEGVMYAGEQIGISGNGMLRGSLLARDLHNFSTTVDQNMISGELNLNCGSELTYGWSDRVKILSWRHVTTG